MKRRTFSLKMAQQSAELLLRNEGITSLPVDPFLIAKGRDIAVEPKPATAAGVSGMLLRHGDSFGIMYATHIASEGFQRFSVSHELGHYFLDGHVDQILSKDGTHVSHAGFVTNNPFELEADHFAAGLLMPRGPFKKAISRQTPGLTAVLSTAKIARTSRTSTAIRYAETTNEAVAIIISTGDTIDYCFMSDAMKSLPELKWLRKGTRLPSDTVTTKLASDPQRVLAGDRVESEVDVMDWLGGKASAVVSEEAIGLGSYGKVLTVLHSEKIGAEAFDDDEIDEKELEERWTPRFHR